MGLSFYRINLRIMWIELKMVGVVVEEVSFDEVSHTLSLALEIYNRTCILCNILSHLRRHYETSFPIGLRLFFFLFPIVVLRPR